MSETIVLWAEGAPGARGDEAIDVPSLTPMLARRGLATGASVIVCPGGGYGHLAPHESEPVGEWLNGQGIAAFVLKYRLAPHYRHPAPLLDAQRAIRTVRAGAAEWDLDPERIGILGFSAGGHLASTAGTHYDAGDPDAEDPIERVSSRPDLMILIYPVVSFGEFGHVGSCKNLLGENPASDLIEYLSNEKRVRVDTPPAFMVHSAKDSGVPCENSSLFAAALRLANVPFELHILEQGPHGLGMGGGDPVWERWPAMCEGWLRHRGFGREG